MMESVWNRSFQVSTIAASMLLLMIIVLTYVHVIKNHHWGVRRPWRRKLILFGSYHAKFLLFGLMIYYFSDAKMFLFVSVITLTFIIGSSYHLGSLGYHYHWEFGTGRLIASAYSHGMALPRDFWYHFTADTGAFTGMQAALWIPWLATL